MLCYRLWQKEQRNSLPLHYQRDYLTNKRRNTKAKIVEYFSSKCNICGLKDHPCVYDLHHLDPKEKDFGIGAFLDRSWNKLYPELQKCILLCSNCHRKLHFVKEEN